MHGWLGIGLIVLGLWMIVSAIRKNRTRKRAPWPAGAIRPEFAAMGEMIRPIILFVVGVLAIEMTLFYFVLAGPRLLSPLDFAGILFVLAAYAGWLIVATRRAVEAPARDPVTSGEGSAA